MAGTDLKGAVCADMFYHNFSLCVCTAASSLALVEFKVMQTVVNRHLILTKKNIHINILMS